MLAGRNKNICAVLAKQCYINSYDYSAEVYGKVAMLVVSKRREKPENVSVPAL